MTENLSLFVESLSDAVLAVAMHVGGKKRLAVLIRPELEDEPDTAARWLLNALDDEHNTAFHAHHLQRAMRIGREAGCDVLAAYVNESTGYEAPRQAAIKSARLRLLERQADIAVEQARIQAELEAMSDQGGVG